MKGQDFDEGNFAEYLVSSLINFYEGTSITLAPIFSSIRIPDYTLTKIVVVDVWGDEHTFLYDLPIKSTHDWIAELVGGTYVVGKSAVDMVITDSSGRHIGSLHKIQNDTPVFIEMVNQILGAYFNREASFFYLPSDVSNYNISFVGLENADYTMVTLVANGDYGNLEEKTSNIRKGEIQSFNTEIFDNGKLTISEISPLELPAILNPKEPGTNETGPTPDRVTEEKSFLPFKSSTEMLLVIGIIATVVAVGVVTYKLGKKKRQRTYTLIT